MTKWCRLTVEVPFDGVFDLAELVRMKCRVCNFELLPDETPAPSWVKPHVSLAEGIVPDEFKKHAELHRQAIANGKVEVKPARRNWGPGSGKNETVLRKLVDKGEPFTGADAKAFFHENGVHASSASATMSRFLQKGWIKHVTPGHRPMQVIKAD